MELQKVVLTSRLGVIKEGICTRWDGLPCEDVVWTEMRDPDLILFRFFDLGPPLFELVSDVESKRFFGDLSYSQSRLVSYRILLFITYFPLFY